MKFEDDVLDFDDDDSVGQVTPRKPGRPPKRAEESDHRAAPSPGTGAKSAGPTPPPPPRPVGGTVLF